MKSYPIPAVVIVCLLAGCSSNPFGNKGKSGLDQLFDPNSAVEDLQELSESGNLDSVQSKILKTYMVRNGFLASETSNANTSYRELLSKALKAGYDGSDTDMTEEAAEASNAALVDLVIMADSTTSTGHTVIVNVSVDNVSDKTIVGLRGNVDVYDVFEDKIHSAEYRMLVPLGPRQRHQKVFSIQLSQTGGMNKILDYSGNLPLRVEWEPSEVRLK